ncbi:hypothetical protein [Acrocarpospora macrocephala]|nr:hypothetical protein [Acrocarpospora macrocephala]
METPARLDFAAARGCHVAQLAGAGAVDGADSGGGEHVTPGR